MLVRLNCSGHAKSVGEEKMEPWKMEGTGDSCMSWAKPQCLQPLGRREERLIGWFFITVEFLHKNSNQLSVSCGTRALCVCGEVGLGQRWQSEGGHAGLQCSKEQRLLFLLVYLLFRPSWSSQRSERGYWVLPHFPEAPASSSLWATASSSQ